MGKTNQRRTSRFSQLSTNNLLSCIVNSGTPFNLISITTLAKLNALHLFNSTTGQITLINMTNLEIIGTATIELLLHERIYPLQFKIVSANLPKVTTGQKGLHYYFHIGRTNFIR